ncbi:MAG: DinB family protein [Terriglobales bacterium]
MATAETCVTAEFASTYRDMMLQGLAGEVATTKKVLSAIPDAKRDYRPDPSGRTAWELAWHIANTDVQFLDGIADGKFNMENPEHKPNTVAELVAWYDENMARASARVRALTPEQLVTPIDFYGVFKLPAAFYLGFLNNHCVHHRGQLATYLRPMGAKCPSIYGGSYDEPWQGGEASDAA